MAGELLILNQSVVCVLLYSTQYGRYFLKETDDKECVGRLDKPEREVGCESQKYKGIKGREKESLLNYNSPIETINRKKRDIGASRVHR